MSFQPSKTEAKKDQFVGDAKETVGSAVGNERLKSEGQTQHGNGLLQETTANLAGAVQGTLNTVTGTVNGALNGFVDGLNGTGNKK
ncbi:hypothetical protein EDC96DRAFT_509130 [Choanephora cucurbitarum]|uniref:CsbD-like domain-containing protein n=1 Tax=Choanephora cucurbitarum TaxID=101091 RepID=A0A1C7NR27_9FUNG|nr:hypothetical protein EDC96DRAFT_509130 [Choanephora cucurbitarum]OBZ91379.1 hypothetical protein A0J61_00564 [Choanephora cucurbitarum]